MFLNAMFRLLPVISLVLCAIAWLVYGLDFPFFDDWRGYYSGNIHSLDPAYLFTPINGTLSPVGLALDALAQRWLKGNSIAYQFLSMVTVLGALLYLQWRLLSQVTNDRVIAATCFGLTIFMLQPGSYWGRENLAYHQALPLVFLLAAFVLMHSRHVRSWWAGIVVALLGFAAGFSYISGAFAAMTAGIALWVSGRFMEKPVAIARSNLGAVLGAVGAIAAATQFYLAVFPFAGSEARAGFRTAFPGELEYWIFLLGKIARSLLLPQEHPAVSLGLISILCVIALALPLFALKRLRGAGRADHEVSAVLGIYLALGAAVFSCLMLVAAARTHLRPDDVQGWRGVFTFAFQRFHFFWATLLWPWLLALALLLFRNRRTVVLRMGSVVGVLAIVHAVDGGALHHAHSFRSHIQTRLPTVSCLHAGLLQGGSMNCPEFNLPDFTPAYIYAYKTKASFVRYFPLPFVGMGMDDPAPLFRLSRDEEGVVRDQLTEWSENRDVLEAGADPKLLVHVRPEVDMTQCAVIDFSVMIAAERDDAAQLFFREADDAGFSEERSTWLAVGGGARFQRLDFRLFSEKGFAGDLRLDPVSGSQKIMLGEAELRCRLRLRDLAQPGN